MNRDSAMNMTTEYLGIAFDSPFMLASAPPAANGDMIRRAFEAGWAGAVTKTLIRTPLANPRNRFAVARSGGAIIGFENLELLSELGPEEWFEIIAGLKRDFPQKPIAASIMGDALSPEDWLYLARGCRDAGADMLELNFSCPHGCPETGGGAAIGQNAAFSAKITRWLSEAGDIRIPVVPKLTAAVADISGIANAVAKAGARGLCAINTMPSFFGFDLKTLCPKPNVNGMTAFGGYSGVGIKPIALRAVAMLCQSPALPVMACGGVSSGFDAAEFMLLGAPVVQVCTEVMLKGFGVVRRMRDELAKFMEWHGFGGPAEFTGRGLDRVAPFNSLEGDSDCVPRIDLGLCERCGACRVACRDGGYQAITPDSGGYPRVDEERCAGCSLCAQVCPASAIRMLTLYDLTEEESKLVNGGG